MNRGDNFSLGSVEMKYALSKRQGLDIPIIDHDTDICRIVAKNSVRLTRCISEDCISSEIGIPTRNLIRDHPCLMSVAFAKL